MCEKAHHVSHVAEDYSPVSWHARKSGFRSSRTSTRAFWDGLRRVYFGFVWLVMVLLESLSQFSLPRLQSIKSSASNWKMGSVQFQQWQLVLKICLWLLWNIESKLQSGIAHGLVINNKTNVGSANFLIHFGCWKMGSTLWLRAAGWWMVLCIFDGVSLIYLIWNSCAADLTPNPLSWTMPSHVFIVFRWSRFVSDQILRLRLVLGADPKSVFVLDADFHKQCRNCNFTANGEKYTGVFSVAFCNDL